MWIESHQSLARHPKTKRLSRLLNASIPAVIGYLHLFWWWAMEYTEDGSLVRYDAADISDAAMWEGEPETFLSGLLSAGFVDERDDGMHIHDWQDYAGKLLEKRRKDAERKRNSATISKEIQRKSSGTPMERAGNLTVPNLTTPNLTPPIIPPSGGDEADSARQENDIGHLHHNSADTRFDAFWAVYPRKVGKEAARKAWMRLRPNTELYEKILVSVGAAKNNETWQRENGRYIPNPATWINQGRWDDELSISHTGGRRQRNVFDTQSPPSYDIDKFMEWNFDDLYGPVGPDGVRHKEPDEGKGEG